MSLNTIYREKFINSWEVWKGVLRNQKLFNLDDIVFVGYGKELFPSKIIGIEKTIDSSGNYEYIYKVTVPKDKFSVYTENYICDYIFSSVEEAKQSRIDCLNSKYKLEMDNINEYFRKYEQL